MKKFFLYGYLSLFMLQVGVVSAALRIPAGIVGSMIGMVVTFYLTIHHWLKWNDEGKKNTDWFRT